MSEDNGTSWTVSKVPGATPGDNDPSVGIGDNGTVYFGYVGADGKPGVAVSRDHGDTWSDLQTVGTEFGIKNAVFPAMVAGDDDRASFAYLGTPEGGNYQDNANFHGEWHLYLTTTYDGGKTWVTSDATPNDPVQVGSICTGGTTCGDDRNLLDFIDVTIDDHGRVEAAFADGCIDACVTDPDHEGRDAYATIARQSGGKPLYSRFDPRQANATNRSLALATLDGGRLRATTIVANSGAKPIRNLAVSVRDGQKRIATQTVDRLAPGARQTFRVVWAASSGRHTVTSIVDPQNRLAESDEGDNKRQKSIRR